MKVKEIRIKDFKCLKDFNADLDGHNVILLGDNEVGKSSLIQFIKICIGDKSCIAPNLNGEGELVMEIDGKPVTFTLTVENGVPYIDVKGDGIRIKNKKSEIAQLIGAIELDPDQFVKLSETEAGRKKQIELFKTLLDEETQKFLQKCENNIKNIFDERAQTNKDIKNLEGSVKLNKMYNHIHELDKFQPVDVSSVMAERDKIQKHNQNVERISNEIVSMDKVVETTKKEIAELQTKIDAHNAVIDVQIEKITKGKEWLKTNSIQSTSILDEQISNATETNKKAHEAEQLKKELEKLEKLRDLSGHQTVNIEVERECLKNAIREMGNPIEGLEFDDEQLIYKGVPVHPASMSTSTRAQLAVILKRAENPSLPILLECSESWGKKKLAWLKELAETEGFQFIAERVESGKEKLELRIMKDDSAN